MKMVRMGGGDKIEKEKERKKNRERMTEERKGKDGEIRKKKEEFFVYRKSMQKIIRKTAIEKEYEKMKEEILRGKNVEWDER